MQVVPLEPARRLHGDGGAAIVEAAFTAPVFMFLLMGVLEFGMYFRNWLALGAGVTDGARVVTIMGNLVNTDYQALRDMKRSMSGMNQGDIAKIIIFDPTNAAAGVPVAQRSNPITAVVPAGCRSLAAHAANSLGCNVYTPAADWGTAPESNYNCTTPGWSASFCPSTRKVAKSGADGPPSFVGIYIEVNHKFITGMLGTTRVMSQQIITRNEPQSLQ